MGYESFFGGLRFQSPIAGTGAAAITRQRAARIGSAAGLVVQFKWAVTEFIESKT